MTRINCIPVEELTNPHLLGEWKELRRVFTLAARWDAKGRRTPIPASYRMGPGHVTFFYDKLGYCYKRHQRLAGEMRLRGFKPDAVDLPAALAAPGYLFGGWQPDAAAMAINRARIAERNATKENQI